jgi:Golgi phosphoprotein 3
MATHLEDLLLHERALLLALHDERGTIHRAGMYAYAVAGGLLAELLLAERIRLEERPGKKKPLVAVVRATQTGDRLVDDVLTTIRTAKRKAPLEQWVSRVANTAKLKHRVARQLVQKGVLREEEDRVLLFFHRRVYPELDPGPEQALVDSLRAAVLGDDDDIDPRTAILAVLGWRAGLLRDVFDRKELKEGKDRLEALGRGDPVAGATQAAIDAVQAAMAAATIAATTAATSAAT